MIDGLGVLASATLSQLGYAQPAPEVSFAGCVKKL